MTRKMSTNNKKTDEKQRDDKNARMNINFYLKNCESLSKNSYEYQNHV